MKKMSFICVLFSIICLAGSAAYLVYRALDKKKYDEKWSDYDECGLA